MDSLRVSAVPEKSRPVACCRCHEGKGHWDRIAGKPYCPNCQELLAQGEADPLVERTQKQRCAVCSQLGTVCYATYPLNAETPVEMDLCPEHLRGLLGRRLGPYAYHQLRRELRTVGLEADAIFLLHDAFYDVNGRALQPAVPPE